MASAYSRSNTGTLLRLLVDHPPAHAANAPSAIGDFRRTVAANSFALTEDLSASAYCPPPPGHADRFQVVLPYAGIFGYAVGQKAQLFDANRTLFVTAGEDYVDTHPVAGIGHASLIVTPARSILDEICGWAGPLRHQAFRDSARPASLRLKLMAQQLRRHAANDDRLHYDELVVATLREAIDQRLPSGGRGSCELVDRAKQVLHACGHERISLDDIARDVGASAVYLTQEFTRTEGIPLYRYQMRLRLGRALVQLPHADSITDLALDLGFSSHSHFSAAFKAAFGLTPSAYRSGELPRTSRC